MKTKLLTIFLFVCLLLVNKTTKAQTIYYDTCNALRAFEGEWRYINSTDTIKLFFRVKNFYSAAFNTVDKEVLGWYEYSQGGTIVQSDYSHRFDVNPDNFNLKGIVHASIGLGFPGCSNVIDTLWGGMTDRGKNNRSQRWIVTRLSPTTVNVYQVMGEGIIGVPFITGFTLPQSFQLIKQ